MESLTAYISAATNWVVRDRIVNAIQTKTNLIPEYYYTASNEEVKETALADCTIFIAFIYNHYECTSIDLSKINSELAHDLKRAVALRKPIYLVTIHEDDDELVLYNPTVLLDGDVLHISDMEEGRNTIFKKYAAIKENSSKKGSFKLGSKVVYKYKKNSQAYIVREPTIGESAVIGFIDSDEGWRRNSNSENMVDWDNPEVKKITSKCKSFWSVTLEDLIPVEAISDMEKASATSMSVVAGLPVGTKIRIANPHKDAFAEAYVIHKYSSIKGFEGALLGYINSNQGWEDNGTLKTKYPEPEIADIIPRCQSFWYKDAEDLGRARVLEYPKAKDENPWERAFSTVVSSTSFIPAPIKSKVQDDYFTNLTKEIDAYYDGIATVPSTISETNPSINRRLLLLLV